MLVDFTVDDDVELGDRTEAAIKTETVLGTKMLELTPRGDGRLTGPIPVERTTSPYDLPDALGDLTTTISGLDTTQLSSALTTLADTFKDTPPDLKTALEGVARFSDTLNTRDAKLRNLLANANKVTGVLAKRSDQIADLVVNANALLAELLSQRNAVDALMTNLTAASRQISGLVGDNRTQLKPALDKLNGVWGSWTTARRNCSARCTCFGSTRCRSAKCSGPGHSSKPRWPTWRRASSRSRSSTRRSPIWGSIPMCCCRRSSSIRRPANPALRRCRCPIRAPGRVASRI